MILLLIAVAAAYVTSIPCRLLHARRRRASWFWALAGSGAVGVLTVLVNYLGDVFTRPGQPPTFGGELYDLVFVGSSIVGFLPSLVVVGHYRRRLRNDTHGP